MNNKIEKSLRQIIQFRNEKLNRIREMGVNPYPYKYDASHRSLEIINNYDELEGKSVSVAGRIVSMRRMGKASFFHIQDQEGKIQIYIKKDDVKEDDYKLFKLLDIGDYVGVKGSVFKTKTGEISVSTDTITLLSKSLRPLPGTKEKDGKTFHTFADKEQRYRQRYLDLIVNPKIKDVFIKRAKIIQSIRDFLDCQRFIEVETPVLQPLYGGAFAKPFTTRHETLDRELYLRISDELYLKRLIIGGFEKVYELSKVFRNEGMDRNHNPEFTMLEFYITYVDYVYLMDFTEKLIQSVAESVEVTDLEMNGHKIDLMQPFRRASYMDLLSEGVGEDISEADEEHLRKLCDSRGIELEKGTHLGKIYEVLMREFVEPNLMKPTFIIDYPIVISPLAKSRRDGNEKIVERFELFIGGCELANAFSELNDPLEQRKRFEQQVTLREAGDEEAQTLDEDFLRAVEIGMPPTGGVGIGIDRLTMLITERKTIKDVILFPAMRSLNKETEAPD
ncbi:MAG: lysine--tRNA ligase [Candidatus Marinimicrobia bacterium]|nr:lysine--tRNA ligase [Candidatus Neomarinimicrobiota bacterium]